MSPDFCFNQVPKMERRLLRDTENAFSKLHAGNPGQHLEKLRGAKDPRVRTIRVNANHRGVVLAAEDSDVYVLFAVLPHDKANAYATSKRFTVNRAYGVLEVRDQEALDNLDLRERDRGSATTAGLFDAFSDAKLVRMGIDEELLPVVRKITSADELDEVEEQLPHVQHSVLTGLALGESPDEVERQLKAELYGGEAPEAVDAEDFAAAVARTPGRYVQVSGPEELREALESSFAAWRVFLHPKQRAVAYRKSNRGPALITGGPGTGKTVTVIHRAAHLAERARGAGTVLVTTFNRALRDSLVKQLDELVDDSEVRSRIRVGNVDRLANEIVSEDRGGSLSMVGTPELESWFERAVQDHGGEFNGRFLRLEWEQVVLAQQLRTEQKYLPAPRRGRGRRISTRQREIVWATISDVLARLRSTGKWTYPQVADEAARICSERPAQYRHVLVDEGQDLHPGHWRLLRSCVAPGPDDLFIASDPNQRIYEHRVSLGSLGIAVRGRSHKLTVSYRTTQETLNWASSVLRGVAADGLDDQPDALDGYRSLVRGEPPTVRSYDTWDDEVAGLVEQVRQWLHDGVELPAIGVAARKNSLAEGVRKALTEAGIACGRQGAGDVVHVDTMHSMKGEEYRCVALVGVDDENTPPPSAVTPAEEDRTAHEQDLQRERCLLFVASTRSRDVLYVSCSGRPSPLLRN